MQRQAGATCNHALYMWLVSVLLCVYLLLFILVPLNAACAVSLIAPRCALLWPARLWSTQQEMIDSVVRICTKSLSSATLAMISVRDELSLQHMSTYGDSRHREGCKADIYNTVCHFLLATSWIYQPR